MKCKIVPINRIEGGFNFGFVGQVWETQFGEYVEASSRAARLASSANPDQAEMLKIGNKIGGDSRSPCCLESLISATPSVIYLLPENPVADWSTLEPIAWELSAGTLSPRTSGFLPSRGQILVRGYGTKTRPPLVTSKDGLRVLIVCGSTKDHTNSLLDTKAAREAIQPSWMRPIPVEPVVIDGKDTLRQLQKTIEKSKRWDIVHVIAHGSRNGFSLCLDENGKESFYDFKAFAELLSTIEGLRLVTLNVCNSSQLALEIAKQFPTVRVIGTLYEMKQETLQRFFATFYGHLLDIDSNPTPFVEEAYGKAVQDLYDNKADYPDWFLPVLYAPVSESPVELLDSTLEQSLGELAKLVGDGKFQEAQTEARRLKSFPDAELRRVATDYLGNITEIRRFHENINSFETAVETCSLSSDPNGWSELLKGWNRKDFRAPVLAGPEFESLPNADYAVSVLPIFESIYSDLENLKKTVLDAVGKLCSFEGGATSDLLNGCKLLLSAATKRPKLRGAAKKGFAKGLLNLLAQSGHRVDEASNTSSIIAAAGLIYDALENLSQVEKLSIEDDNELLNQGERDEILRGSSQITAKAVSVLSGFSKASTREADAGWLQPGRRIEICLWWLGSDSPITETPAALSTDSADSTLAELMALAKRLSESKQIESRGGLQLDPATFPPNQLSLLVNEAAPFLLTRELSQPFDPYLCVAALGEGPDTSAQDIRDKASFEAADIVDAARREILSQASQQLSDLKRRLCFDAFRFPVEKADECTSRFRNLSDSILTGAAIPDGVFSALAPLDRAGLLAVCGKTAEASDLMAKLAFDKQDDVDLVRGAYLATVHHASFLPCGSEEFAESTRRAMALLGILVGNPQLLSGWIGRRYAVYQQAVPADRSALTESVTTELASLLRKLLDNAEVTASRKTARRLRTELSAELEGAKERGTAKLFGMRGIGYHAARLSGTLIKDGQQLANVYGRLAGMASGGYMPYVAMTGMSIQAFHRLVFLFSELRLATVEPSEDALEPFLPLLPSPEDLASETEPPPEVTDFFDTPSFAERYPCHAAMEEPKRAAVLSAHIAIVATDFYIEELKRELLGTPKLARTTSILDKISGSKRYVANLGYELAGSSPDLMAPVEGLCSSWMGRVLEQEASSDSVGEPEGRRDRLQAATRLADRISNGYGLTRGSFNSARGKLHLVLSVLLSNEFHEVEKSMGQIQMAYNCDPEAGIIVCNFARASGNYAPLLLGSGKKEEARRVLDKALEVVHLFVQNNPDSAGEVQEELRDIEKARRTFDTNPQFGSPQRLESE